MQTLLEVLAEVRRLGDREALRFHNGFRTWKFSYGDLYRRIGAAAAYLDQAGLARGDRVIFWSENRPEWVALFWACVARGIHVVPVDYQSSIELVRRIQREVSAKLLAAGDQVHAEGLAIPQVALSQVAALVPDAQFEPAAVSPDDPVEIVYTSGTTGDPVGIVHRHRNICANLAPIQSEMRKYESMARPFQPVRILDMLPLSHLFGQSLGIFIPPLLGGAVVFMLELHAGAILRTIRRERVSVLVSVPKLMVNLQKEVERDCKPPDAAARLKGIPGIAEKWWRYRRVHRALGWKFWALIVGGAEVAADAEAFWLRLGFLVIQGYGLTETSPVVALNHPFHAQSGSLGKPLPGQEIKIAGDGEILVRGESVIDESLGEGGERRNVVEDGWLHTGDIGEIDTEGRLYYRGRKKEMIVTAEGLNVFPQDVERVLNSLPAVKDSAVVAVRQAGGEQVHAALILRDASADPAAIVAEANRRLESHQRIRSWSVWLDVDFPRTPSTMKVKRGEVARRIRQGGSPEDNTGAGAILARLHGAGSPVEGELDLSSLERVELLSELENKYGVELDEGRFAEIASVQELESLLRQADGGEHREHGRELPRWARNWVARAFRFMALEGIILPLFRRLARIRVEGLENLKDVAPPVLFAANHQSDLDTPAVFAALGRKWRHRISPAMSMDFFRAWFEPHGDPLRVRLEKMSLYYLAAALFNAYPLPQRMTGVRRALEYTGELADAGFCPLVYPEGVRSPDGQLQPFRSGIGMMAIRLRVPVVPIYLRGMFEIYSVHHEWPQAGDVMVTIGEPMRFDAQTDETTVTRAIEAAIAGMAQRHFTS